MRLARTPNPSRPLPFLAALCLTTVWQLVEAGSARAQRADDGAEAVRAGGGDEASSEYEDMRVLLGGRCSIRVHHPDAELARMAIQTAMTEVTRIGQQLDSAAPGSEVRAINTVASLEAVPVSPETLGLLDRSLTLCRQTSGAFDPTVASYDYLWSFSARPFVRPLPQELGARRALTGCRQVVLTPGTTPTVRILQHGVRVTLQDLWHGYACDRAAQVLRQAGVQDFQIRIGQDAYAQGRSQGRIWSIPIANPRNPGQIVTRLFVDGEAVATRSDGERFTVKGRHRYHDVLDPRTGVPVDGVLQVTVVAKDATLADGLSAAVFVLGPRAGIDLLNHEDQAEGFLIDSTGRVFASSGMGAYGRVPERTPLNAAGD
jgi:thiamine biosynthesis lipoprotein